MSNILELSGLFVFLGGLVKFFSAWGNRIAWLWFPWAGISTQADTMPSEINNDLSLIPSTLYLQCSGPISQKSRKVRFKPGLLGGGSS